MTWLRSGTRRLVILESQRRENDQQSYKHFGVVSIIGEEKFPIFDNLRSIYALHNRVATQVLHWYSFVL